jgi:excisionase family DNA binding protein
MPAPLDLNALLDALADRLADRVVARLAANGNGADPEPGPDQLLSADEVAARLGVSKRWVYCNAGKLPMVRLPGRSLRFSARGLEKYPSRRQG